MNTYTAMVPGGIVMVVGVAEFIVPTTPASLIFTGVLMMIIAGIYSKYVDKE